MASRTKRKRYRRRLAKANALGPEICMGWGQGTPVTRRDLALLRRAIRDRWAIPERTRQAAADDVKAALNQAGASPSMQLAVCKTLVDMGSDNIRRSLTPSQPT